MNKIITIWFTGILMSLSSVAMASPDSSCGRLPGAYDDLNASLTSARVHAVENDARNGSTGYMP